LDDLEVGTPRLVRRKAFSKVTKLCPGCLSPLKRLSELGGWLVPQDYYCPSCGYRGYVNLEPDPDRPKD